MLEDDPRLTGPDDFFQGFQRRSGYPFDRFECAQQGFRCLFSDAVDIFQLIFEGPLAALPPVKGNAKTVYLIPYASDEQEAGTVPW